jgi:hypothetical protein
VCMREGLEGESESKELKNTCREDGPEEEE